jgi:MFS family permease
MKEPLMLAAVALRRLSRNRPLALLIGAGALSAFGDWLYLAALPIIVYQQTHDAALVGLAAAGRLLPFLLLSVPAGVVVDRFDRRLVTMVAEAIRCVLMLAMAAAYILGAGVVVLIVLATGAAAGGTFAMPAQNALVPQLARDDDELGLANATSATLGNVANVLGPIVAGGLVIATGLGAAFVVNGLSFAVVVVTLIAIRPARSQSAPEAGSDDVHLGTRDEPVAGWSALARSAAGPIVLDAAVSFGAGALGVLPVLIAVDGLHAGAAFAGVLGAAAGLGAVGGGLVAGLLVNGRPGRGIRLGIAVAGGAIGLLGLSGVPMVAIGASALAVGALVLLDTLNITAIQRSVPQAALGRIFGVLHTSAAVWLIGGSAIPPIVATLAGIHAAVVLTGGVVAGLGALSVAVRRAGASTVVGPTADRSFHLNADGQIVEPAIA